MQQRRFCIRAGVDALHQKGQRQGRFQQPNFTHTGNQWELNALIGKGKGRGFGGGKGQGRGGIMVMEITAEAEIVVGWVTSHRVLV